MAFNFTRDFATGRTAPGTAPIPSMHDMLATASIELALPTTLSSPASPTRSVSYNNSSQHCATVASLANKTPLNAVIPANTNKSALSFILSPQSTQVHEYEDLTSRETSSEVLLRYEDSACVAVSKPSWLSAAWLTPTKGAAINNAAATGSSLVNTTDVRSFQKAAGLCTVDGCTKLSKHSKLCWRHGGSIKCKVANCDNRAKSKGVCWSHGGGTLCRVEGCGTIAVSRGVCWAHGGGKRCRISGCSRPAYERIQNWCVMHFKAFTACYQEVKRHPSEVNRVQLKGVRWVMEM